MQGKRAGGRLTSQTQAMTEMHVPFHPRIRSASCQIPTKRETKGQKGGTHQFDRHFRDDGQLVWQEVLEKHMRGDQRNFWSTGDSSRKIAHSRETSVWTRTRARNASGFCVRTGSSMHSLKVLLPPCERDRSKLSARSFTASFMEEEVETVGRARDDAPSLPMSTQSRARAC